MIKNVDNSLLEIGGVIAILVVLFEVIPVIGYQTSNVIPDATSASGTLTINGSVSCGELVNITTSTGNLIVFEFNVTDSTCKHAINEYTTVNISDVATTIEISQNLTATMNKNNTFNKIMVAS